MGFTLDKVVPWGRSYEEYVAMFALTEADLQKRILGCGDGPASFNAELTRRGGRVVSVDPLYRFPAENIRSRIDATFDTVIEQTGKNHDDFAWKHIRDVEELKEIRTSAMDIFLNDFSNGKERYVEGKLPVLPFADDEFDLALCSHLLFLYSEQLSADFHIQSIKELCRIAQEVRVFPLLELNAKKSRHLEQVISFLEKEGIEWQIKEVPYEFQKGGFEMLHYKRP
jgi:SAM-dependent methyltransferase